MMGVGSSMVSPLGVRAVLIAQAGVTEGSPMMLNDALTSISIILLEEDGSSMRLPRVLLLSCLIVTSFGGLIPPELALPSKVTELPAQALCLLVSVQSVCFLVTAQSLRFFCFLVAARLVRFLIAAQSLRFLLTAQLLRFSIAAQSLCSLTLQLLRFLLTAQLLRLLTVQSLRLPVAQLLRFLIAAQPLCSLTLQLLRLLTELFRLLAEQLLLFLVAM